MKIIVLDPGLASINGHHFDLDLRLFKTLQHRGHQVVVHGFIKPEHDLEHAAGVAGIQLCKTFRVKPYAPLPRDQSPHDAYRMLEDATSEDLINVEKRGLWFWPTLTPYQLAAGLRVGAEIRQIGGAWWLPRVPLASGEGGSESGACSWANSTKRLMENKSNFLVGAYDELLCQGFRTFSSGLTIHHLPCPHDGTQNKRQPKELKIIGFFGHQRRNRGLDILPPLVDALLHKGFEVVIQDSSGKIKVRSYNSRLRVLDFIDDFPAEIAKCDAIVWPSRWEAYTHSWSGVVSESIATGVPVIVPSGCIPAELVARYEAGTYFHEFSTEAILAAVEDAAARYPRLLAAARAAARDWSAHNGTARLAEWLESHSGVAT